MRKAHLMLVGLLLSFAANATNAMIFPGRNIPAHNLKELPGLI